jgi:hypothetical protein
LKIENGKQTIIGKKLIDLIDASDTVAMRLTRQLPPLNQIFEEYEKTDNNDDIYEKSIIGQENMKLNQENILEKTDQNILNKELFECEINKKDLEIDFENILGKGSFGNVYKGKWFGTEVAIKEMIEIEDENIIKLISREISILRNVRHPNIIQFIGICRCDYGFFIITELIEGGDLRRLLKSGFLFLFY